MGWHPHRAIIRGLQFGLDALTQQQLEEGVVSALICLCLLTNVELVVVPPFLIFAYLKRKYRKRCCQANELLDEWKGEVAYIGCLRLNQ